VTMFPMVCKSVEIGKAIVGTMMEDIDFSSAYNNAD
jgi:hypothetical protein